MIVHGRNQIILFIAFLLRTAYMPFHGCIQILQRAKCFFLYTWIALLDKIYLSYNVSGLLHSYITYISTPDVESVLWWIASVSSHGDWPYIYIYNHCRINTCIAHNKTSIRMILPYTEFKEHILCKQSSLTYHREHDMYIISHHR